jgi:hypothetical protein
VFRSFSARYISTSLISFSASIDLGGVTLSFLSHRQYGSIVIVSSNIPLKDLIARS